MKYGTSIVQGRTKDEKDKDVWKKSQKKEEQESILNELYFWTLSIVWCLKKIEE
jgi:hypothetical protein